MARNGSGTYSLPLSDVVAGNTILASWANTTLDDLATAMSASLAKDGQTNPTANLPMNTYRHTGVGQAAARTDYIRADQLIDGDLLYLTAVAGTDTITATGPLSTSAYVTGMLFVFKAAGNNTGATTLNINAIGAATIQYKGAALAADDIVSGRTYLVVYDGTNFQLINGSTFGDTGIDELAALSPTDSYFIVGNGSSWVTETGATVRTSLGLGTGDTPQFTGLDLSGGQLDLSVGADLTTSDVTAGALALGTDGNFFDFTGTDTITSIGTVGVGTLIAIQFDDAATLTHHATDLILPGGANITTAAGDIALFYEYASGDWRCISYQTAATAPGALQSDGSWELISETTLGGSETEIDFTGLDGSYDVYRIWFQGIQSDTDADSLHVRVGTGGTPTWQTGTVYDNNTLTARILASSMGAASGEAASGYVDVFNIADTSLRTLMKHIVTYTSSSGAPGNTEDGGDYTALTAVTALRLYFFTGGFAASGRVGLYGLKKA